MVHPHRLLSLFLAMVHIGRYSPAVGEVMGHSRQIKVKQMGWAVEDSAEEAIISSWGLYMNLWLLLGKLITKIADY